MDSFRMISPTVWAEVPQALRVTVPRMPWKAKRFSPAIGSFLEGPAFDRDGGLYLVDVAHGRILRTTGGEAFEVVADYDGEPNGLAVHRDGSLYIADYRHGILRLDPGSGQLATILSSIGGGPLKGPNDLTFANDGDLYFTDQGETGLSDPSGRLVRLRGDGSVDVLLDNVPSPNGLAINQAQTVLFLAVTRANAIWRVPLAPSGQVSKVGLAIQLSGGNGPDGLAMDEDDNLYVAHNKAGRVLGFTRWGLPLCEIISPRGIDTTNIAFGGPGNRSLFITESGSQTVLRAELPVSGVRLFSHL